MSLSSETDARVEERVAQIQEIADRRNALLRELFHLLERRESIDSILSTEETEGAVDSFLDRFDLTKYPDTGSILHLAKEELMVPSPYLSNISLPTPLSSPPMETETLTLLPLEDESPMSDVPVSPEVALNHGIKADSPPPPEENEAPSRNSPYASSDVPMQIVEDMLSAEPHSETPSVHDAEEAMEDVTGEEPVEIFVDAQEAQEIVKSPISALGTSSPVAIVEDISASPPLLPVPIVSHTSPSPSPFTEILVARPTSDVEHEPIATLSPASPSPGSPGLDLAKDSAYPGSSSPPAVEPTVLEEDIAQQPVEQVDIDMVPPQTESITPPQPSSPIPMTVTAMPPEAFMLPPYPSSQVTISASLTPIRELPGFDFAVPQIVEPPPPAALTSTYQTEFTLDRDYTLPPLKFLPAEFQRKAKLNKRKREKGTDKADGRKDDWAPMGINKWGVTMRTNPLWKRMSRATKTLSTREWGVAFAELRFIRTLERVEAMKDAGKWSYRQPKKQRGVGGLAKTHWDYLLDEMKWMRIDFREERKWKMALAYDLSTEVLKWHEAGNRDRRKELGIVVNWTRPTPQEILPEDPSDVAGAIADPETMELDYPEPEPQLNLPAEYGSDDSDDEQEQDKQDVDDALEATALLEEALDTTERGTDSEQPQSQEVRPKEEDVDDASLLVNVAPLHIVSSPGNAGGDATLQATPVTEPVSSGTSSGLKSTSDDPILSRASQPLALPGETLMAPPTKMSTKSNAYAPLRSQIAYSNEHTFFLDFDELHLLQTLQIQNESTAAVLDPPPPPGDLSAIFPDLTPFNFLDLNPAAVVASRAPADGRKKGEKRDRDDPHKRTEPTTYNKLTPVGTFMLKRPTLLGPLQPSEHWKQDHWTSFDDSPVVPDLDTPAKTGEDALCGLFEGSKLSLYNPVDDDSILPSTPRDPSKRAPDGLWTEQDDMLLKRLVERYPKNWGLIADTFNSARGAISTERRSDWECKERFRVRWIGKERTDRELASYQDGGGTPTTSARPQLQMTTRKRMASISTSVPSGTPAPPMNTEPKKRRRHALLYETVRKVVKKKEAAQKAIVNNTRKPSAVHDTHNQFAKMPKLSPAELSRMKAEKEYRDHAEAVANRRKAEEHARAQVMASQHAQRMGAQVPAQGQQSPAAQSTPNGAARPPANGLPHHQAVPQIRNISQQQRLPPGATPRMSPQQMLQVQAAQQRVLAATNANMAAAGPSAAHLSPPPYAQRAATSSPVVQSSPPHSSATPQPPRPPSAQQQTGFAQPSPNMAHPAALPRPGTMGHYYPIPAIHGSQYTQEQMEHAMRLQQSMIAQQQRQNMQQQQQQQGGGYPP